MEWDRYLKQQYAVYVQEHGITEDACDAATDLDGSLQEESCSPVTTAAATDDDASLLLARWSDAFLDTLSANDRHLVEFIKTMSFQLDRGVPLEELALHGMHNDWGWRDIGGTDHIAAHGMSRVVDALVHRIKDGVTLRLGERVTRIDYRQFGVCRVSTESNHSYTADACIVTLPIGVLKMKADVLFVPPLPDDKRDVLRRAGVAAYNTLAVYWNVPVCQSGSTAFYLVGHPDVNNPLRFGFICSAQLRNPQDTNSITQFYISGRDHPFDDLQYWKEQAVAVVGALQSDVALSNIADVQISAWHLDDDMLGSYSASTRATRGDADRRILASPLGHTVYFAGEHTHFEGRYQSIDGAYETGMRAALEVTPWTATTVLADAMQ
jgi:monoamine oxidase